MMRQIQKTCIILLCFVLLLCEVCPMVVSGEPFGDIGITYGLTNIFSSSNVVHWRKGKTIPIVYDLYIYEGTYTFQISSTLDISHTLDTQRVYTSRDKALYLDVKLLELPEKQIIPSSEDYYFVESIEGVDYVRLSEIKCEQIQITAYRDGSTTPCYSPTITIYILNCQYGLFLSVVDEDSLFRGIQKWRETNLQRVIMTTVVALIVTVCAVGFVIWLMRRNKIKKRIADIQAISTSPGDSSPSEVQYTDTTEGGPQNE